MAITMYVAMLEVDGESDLIGFGLSAKEAVKLARNVDENEVESLTRGDGTEVVNIYRMESGKFYYPGSALHVYCRVYFHNNRDKWWIEELSNHDDQILPLVLSLQQDQIQCLEPYEVLSVAITRSCLTDDELAMRSQGEVSEKEVSDFRLRMDPSVPTWDKIPKLLKFLELNPQSSSKHV